MYVIIITFPRHVSYDNVETEREFAVRGGGAVSDRLKGVDMFAFSDDRDLVNASPLIGADELLEAVGVEFIGVGVNEVIVYFNFDGGGVDAENGTGAFGEDHNAGIASGFEFHTCPDEGSLSFEERDGLTLHIGTHESAIGVVIFEEGNKSGSDRDDLLGGNVHEVNGVAADFGSFLVTAGGDAFIKEPIGVVERFVSLSDD